MIVDGSDSERSLSTTTHFSSSCLGNGGCAHHKTGLLCPKHPGPVNQRNQPERLLFVTSCYNEAGNVEELYRRCREVFVELQATLAGAEQLQFAMIFADNHSSDATLTELKAIAAADPCVQVLANHRNYGPEASFANALAQATPRDLVVGIASDLQDPPEIAAAFIRELVSNAELDAVLAVKQQSSNNPLLRFFRRIYYLALGYSSRLQPVPNGFHGFGAYRAEVIEETLQLWNSTGFNLRMCLVNGSQSPRRWPYRQAKRHQGVSTYGWWGYPREAIMGLLAADSTASRLAFGLSAIGIVAASVIGVLLLLNWLGGNSRYEPGLPTVMALVLGSFAVQMLMVAVLSRQVEELRVAGLRPRVRFEAIGQRASDC